MSRMISGFACLLIVSLLSTTASAQGFTLNPFTKKEPEPDSIRRSLSDTPPPQQNNSGFKFPTLPLPKLPAPQMPKMQFPKMQIPNPLGLPGLGPAKPNNMTGPQKPTAFQQLNRNTQKFFKNTTDFVTAPWRSMSSSGTPARQASSQSTIPQLGTSRITPARRRSDSSSNSGGGLLGGLPTWLGGSGDNSPPPKPKTVSDFLGQRRPGFDDQ